ncbi:MAG TPA: hypothetical protein PLL88_05275 [Anaerolineaceae bacterium]|jgi:hypothetical protein|nr:hypothetical protein [Anaerolineaceae bacterium]
MRMPLKLAIISICCLAIISVACSFPFFQSGEEEIVIPTLAQQVITVLVTAAPEEDKAAETDTPAPTAVVVMDVDWDDQWTIWMGDSSKGYTINFLIQGNKFSGSTVLTNKNSISFIGTIQESGGTVVGTWENTDGTHGDFTIYMNEGENFFTGHMSGSSALCGSRDNIKPSACFK